MSETERTTPAPESATLHASWCNAHVALSSHDDDDWCRMVLDRPEGRVMLYLDERTGEPIVSVHASYADESSVDEAAAVSTVVAEMVAQAQAAIRRRPPAARDGVACSSTWCVIPGSPGEHSDYHSSDPVDLAEARDTDQGRQGWWSWVSQDVGFEPKVQFEYVGPGTGDDLTHFDFEVDAAQVAMILWATSTPAAREALTELVNRLA